MAIGSNKAQRWMLGCAMGLVGCANADEPAAGSSEEGMGEGSGSSSGSASAGEHTGQAPGDGDGPRLDLGSGDDPSTSTAGVDDASTEGGASAGTCGAIDVLFVVDSTAEMAAAQVTFVDALPEFVSELAAATSDSVRYMVIDTDAENQCTAQSCAAPSETIAKLCVLPGGGYACNGHFVDCDDTFGAGVVNPAGAFATNQECDVVGPKRWLGAEDEDPAASLTCMGHVGIAGVEHARPMDAMQAALFDEQLAPTGCNAGFLREDALLVVVFISNDPCSADTGKPQDWYASLAETVGDPQDVVVVGFVPGIDGCTVIGNEPPGCGSADQIVDGAHWAEFVGLWQEHGVLANVCDQSSYPDVLAQATDVIVSACAGLE